MMEKLLKNSEHNTETRRELLISAIREILLDYYKDYNLKKRETFSLGFMSLVILEYSKKSGLQIKADDLLAYNNLIKEIIDIIEKNIADRQAGGEAELLTEISDDYINIIKRAVDQLKGKIKEKPRKPTDWYRLAEEKREEKNDYGHILKPPVK